MINNLIEPDDDLLAAPERYFSIDVEAQGPLNVQVAHHTYESGSLVSIDTINRCVYVRPGMQIGPAITGPAPPSLRLQAGTGHCALFMGDEVEVTSAEARYLLRRDTRVH